jgi:hypothetical protein
MGVKTTVASVTYAANHIAAATTAGQNVTSLQKEILLQTQELIRNLQILVGQMQAGDPNIATINAQIAALS